MQRALGILCIGFLLWNALLTPAVSGAEPAPGVHRIGYLNPGSAALAPIRLEPLRQGLGELGYVEMSHNYGPRLAS